MPESADLARLRAEYARRDRHSADQDIYSLSNPAYVFLIQQRQRAVLAALRQQGLLPFGGRRILELGCGQGAVLLEWLNSGIGPGQLYGLDLLIDRLNRAHVALPTLPLACGDGQSLPYPTASFDGVLQYTVFTSLLDETVRVNVAQELLRVLTPKGFILWYDFWLNPTNTQTRGIGPAEVRRLFPACRYKFQKITLAPPITRRLIKVSSALCLLLEKLTVFNSHYLAIIRPLV